MQKRYQIKHKLNQKDLKDIRNQTQTETKYSKDTANQTQTKSKRFKRHTKSNTK